MGGAGWGFQKFNRRAQDWAIVGVAAWRRNGDSGVALVNMGSTPVLASAVSAALAGGASVADAAEQAAADAEPQADLNASVEYRSPPGQGARPPRPGGRQRLSYAWLGPRHISRTNRAS